MNLLNTDVYTADGRRIGRVLVEREFLTLGRSVRFLRRRPFVARVDDLPNMADPLPVVTADVERMHGAPGLRTSDPVEHWTEVNGFQKANVQSFH